MNRQIIQEKNKKTKNRWTQSGSRPVRGRGRYETRIRTKQSKHDKNTKQTVWAVKWGIPNISQRPRNKKVGLYVRQKFSKIQIKIHFHLLPSLFIYYFKMILDPSSFQVVLSSFAFIWTRPKSPYSNLCFSVRGMHWNPLFLRLRNLL